jgi:hypothetical protein
MAESMVEESYYSRKEGEREQEEEPEGEGEGESGTSDPFEGMSPVI